MANWDRFITIIQMASRNGRILAECVWKKLILLQNGNEEFWGIGLV